MRILMLGNSLTSCLLYTSGLGGLFPGNRPGRLCRGKMLFRIPWERDVDYTLLRRMIAFNRTEKAHCKTFWRGKA